MLDRQDELRGSFAKHATMSVVGTKRTCPARHIMSVLGGKADIKDVVSDFVMAVTTGTSGRIGNVIVSTRAVVNRIATPSRRPTLKRRKLSHKLVMVEKITGAEPAARKLP